MRTQILTTVALFGTISPLFAGTNPAAQQLLATAEKQARIFEEQAGPIHLEIGFVAQMNVPMRGHFSLKWQSKDRWWSKVVIGDFEQISMQDGEMLYTVRNRPTPMRVGEINSLIHFAQLPDELNAKKMKEQVKNGVAITCLQAEREKYKSEVHEICVDQASNEILSDAWPEPPDEHRREQFEDYFDFQGHRYPRKLQLQVNGSKVITANVESLQTAPFDKALLIPPQGAIERRECPDLKHAQPVKTPDPAYPQSASHNGLMGDTAVAMTVLTDGSVSDIHLIETSTHSMDEATLQNLKGWKFKPAMCGSEPVVSDIEVVVSFRLTQ